MLNLYREIVVTPCRVFYRVEGDAVFLLHVMRAERLLRKFIIEERNRNRQNLPSPRPSGKVKSLTQKSHCEF